MPRIRINLIHSEPGAPPEMRLSHEEYDQIVYRLEDQHEPNEAMKRLFERHQRKSEAIEVTISRRRRRLLQRLLGIWCRLTSHKLDEEWCVRCGVGNIAIRGQIHGDSIHNR
jgi:hypothetical protein